jgi:actin-like ATPase involved in cell morphogenesis
VLRGTKVGVMRMRASVAVDLGTVNTLVWVAGRGLVIEEPSAVAIDSATGAVVAIGTAADVLSEKEPQGLQVVHPLRDGVIADLDAAAAMLVCRSSSNGLCSPVLNTSDPSCTL